MLRLGAVASVSLDPWRRIPHMPEASATGRCAQASDIRKRNAKQRFPTFVRASSRGVSSAAAGTTGRRPRYGFGGLLDPSRSAMLLALRAKLGKWLQLGGHADGHPDALGGGDAGDG